MLVNTRTGKRAILGASIVKFADEHGLCMNEVWKLLNGRKIVYRDWMLVKSLELAQVRLTDGEI